MRKLSMEIIDYQRNDPFPGKIILLVDGILRDIQSGKYKTNSEVLTKHPNVKKLTTEIHKRLGLKIIIDPVISNYQLLAIIPFHRDSAFSFGLTDGVISKYMAKTSGFTLVKRFNALIKKRKTTSIKVEGSSGWINTKLAKVGGYLSELPHYLLINFISLERMGLNSREISATILHELGHAFSGLEQHHKLVKGNSTISGILEDINGNKPDIIYHRYKHFFDKSDINKIALSTDKDVVNLSEDIARVYREQLGSDYINPKYDETNFENMADTFVGRFGMADDVTTALVKLHNTGNDLVRFDHKYLWYLHNLVHMLGTCLVFYWMGPAGSVIATSLFYSLLKTKDPTMTYDFPLDRINRLRNSVVGFLKEVDLDDALVKNLIEQYEVITDILIHHKEMYSGMERVARRMDIFNPSNRQYVQTQQTIENILNNSLFVSSAKIKTI